MSRRVAIGLFSFTLLVFSGSAYAGDRETVVEKLNLLASRPIMDVLQAQHISGQERTTAYIYANRIEYYDDELLKQIELLGKLPAISEQGVLFTEVFLTQFRQRPDLYVVQRGWDRDGNCHVLTTKLGIHRRSFGQREGASTKNYEIEMEESNSCSGAPCRKCAPYDPSDGCLCERIDQPGDRCNHTVSTELE